MLSIDLLFLSPPWTITALPAMGVSSILAFSYWFWVEQCYKHNGWSVFHQTPLIHLFPLVLQPPPVALLTCLSGIRTRSSKS